MSSLDLGLVGNCNVAALIDRDADIVWYCLPRIDGDPVFHRLLGAPRSHPASGAFVIELEGQHESEQSYIENTAILRTVLKSEAGNDVRLGFWSCENATGPVEEKRCC